jgi:preprotein translocase SecF subunit
MWPLCKYVPKATNLTFVRYAGVAGIFSILMIVATVASIVTGGFRLNPIAVYERTEGGAAEKFGAIFSQSFNLGIDFKGGNLLELEASAPVDLESVRNAVSALDLGDVQVQGFDYPNRALVTFETASANPANENAAVMASLRAAIPTIVDFPRIEVVGPKVSGELFTGGIIALGLSILLMLIYIWFRFEWQFGLGAVLALFHDVILTLGLFSVTRLEFTLTIIAALLTIIGYSMNDTVVVFDRLRENLRKYKKKSLGDVIDLSLNETLSRTIITGCTALLALTGLLFVGGDALSGFAIAMIFGIIIGTYSSVYIAAPAILLWGVNRGGERKETGDEAVEALP